MWTVLNALMGADAWLVWRDKGFTGAGIPLGLFVAQTVLNGLWSFLFFGLKRPGLAFGEIVLLWLAIVATGVAFWRTKPATGLMMAPYWSWVSFAAVLNFYLWRLNP